jgi:hypothetical protein
MVFGAFFEEPKQRKKPARTRKPKDPLAELLGI